MLKGCATRPDPSKSSIDVSDPETLNSYTYVLDDPLNNVDPDGLRCTLVAFGFKDNIGKFSKSVPNSAAAYPYSGQGLLGDMAGLFKQSLFGANSNTETFISLYQQYQNEPGGLDLAGFSGGAQVISTAFQSGRISSANVQSITYLSPGLGFGGHLYHVADTQSFKGSGFIDFAATFVSRLNGEKLQSTGCSGHDALCELQAAAVASRLAPPGSRGPCTPNNQAIVTSGGGILFMPNFYGMDLFGNFIAGDLTFGDPTGTVTTQQGPVILKPL